MRRPTTPAAATIAGFLAGVLAVAGCGPATPTAPPPSPSPSASVSARPPASSAAPSPASVGVVVVDRTLLDVLPDEVGGQPIQSDEVTAAEIADRGDLAPSIEAIAVALYIQPGSSTADDFAIVNVVRLRPGVFEEAWFRSWRTTYDEGACEIAGGVQPGTAVAEIAEHETHIGSCLGGVHTYHVHLTNPDRVVSITAAGAGRFGERVVAGLTE